MAWGAPGRRGWPIPDTVSYKVKVTAADTTASWLWDALAAGAGISLAVLNPGADEQVEISCTTSIGPGTVNTHAMWTGVNAIGDSLTSEDTGWTRINSMVLINSTTNPTVASGSPRLWVRSNNVGFSPNLVGNDIVLESNAEPAFTFLTIPNHACYQYYQSAVAAPTVRFGYDFNDDKFKWKILAVDLMQLGTAWGLTVLPPTDATGILIDGNAVANGRPTLRLKAADVGGNLRSQVEWVDHGNNGFKIQYDVFNNSLITKRVGGKTYFQCHENQKYWGADRNENSLAFQLPILTTVERNALVAQTGFMIYNTTTNQPDYYNGAAWV